MTKQKKATPKKSNKGQSTTRGGTSQRSSSSRRSQSKGNSKAKGKRSTSTKASESSRQPRFQFPKVRIEFDMRKRAIVFGFGIIIFVLLALLSMFSANQGVITGGLINLMWMLFGWGGPIAFGAFGFLGFWLVLWGMNMPPKFSFPKLFGSLVLFLVFEGFSSLYALFLNNGLNSLEEVANASSGGGLVGYLISQFATDLIGVPAAIFVFTVLGIVSALMISGVSLNELQGGRQPQPAGRLAGANGAAPELSGSAEQPPLPLDMPSNGSRRGRKNGSSSRNGRSAASEAIIEEVPHDAADKPVVEEEDDDLPVRPIPAEKPTRRRSRSKAKSNNGLPKPSGRPKRENGKPAPKEKEDDARMPARPEPIFTGRNSSQVRSWTLPDISELLDKGTTDASSDTHIHQQVIVIEETLTSFGAPGQVVDVKQGPTIIQYCVEPKYIEQRSGKRTKVKVGKIASLADDISLALAARSVRIQAPVPGEAYVGIEVPNEAKNIVSLRDVMEDESFHKINRKSKLAVGMGEDVSGQPTSIDLAKMPHMLVAGATGSGKSVCINAIIASLLIQNSPEDLKLVMVDPKRVELTGYNGIPHLAAPVVVDMDRVVGTLQWALREMDDRYKAFAEIGARNIIDFNSQMAKRRKEKLPYIVIIVDELADLMMMAPDETERSIARLAQMARATGIHMILATQRPSVDVVTGLIKANFPARVAFAVASSTDSRVVLDTTGAERLLGQGDMLFQSPDAPAPVRLQGCYVSDGELNRIIEYWKQELRRATSEMHNQTNFISASTDVIKKTELDQDVWDAETPEQRQAKAEMDEIIKSQDTMALGPSKMGDAPAENKDIKIEGATYLPPEAPVDEDYSQKHDVEREEPFTPLEERDSDRDVSKRRASPTMARSKPISDAIPEAAELASAEESQPPLWEEMRDQLEAEQEKALTHKQFGNDELWDEAIAFIREKKGASTSMLQRRFRIGYTRAARLIDRMEDAGIIGPPTGTSKQREVFPAKDDE